MRIRARGAPTVPTEELEMPDGSIDSRNGQTIYPEFLKELVAAEDAQRVTLESRGAGVITSSGALVTLLLAFAALVTKRNDFTLGSGTRLLLMISVGAFIAAALLAIWTYAPQERRIVDGAALKDELPAVWDQDAEFARKKITATRLDQLQVSQHANDVKAGLLGAAVVAEVIGVVLLAVSVIVIL